MADPAGPASRRAAEASARRAAVTELGPVLEAAARFLEARPRSVAEMRRRLAAAGYRPELVEAAIAHLGDLGYLDDEAFARAWIESRDRAHPRGEAMLRHELAIRGVEAPTIDRALGERREGADAARPEEGRGAGGVGDLDAAAARQLLERRSRALLREPDPRRRRERAYALLARNGFDPDTCRETVAAWIASAAAVSPEKPDRPDRTPEPEDDL